MGKKPTNKKNTASKKPSNSDPVGADVDASPGGNVDISLDGDVSAENNTEPAPDLQEEQPQEEREQPPEEQEQQQSQQQHFQQEPQPQEEQQQQQPQQEPQQQEEQQQPQQEEQQEEEPQQKNLFLPEPQQQSQQQQQQQPDNLFLPEPQQPFQQQNLFTPPQPTLNPSSSNSPVVTADGTAFNNYNGNDNDNDNGNAFNIRDDDDEEEELDLEQFQDNSGKKELAFPVLSPNQSQSTNGPMERSTSTVSMAPSALPEDDKKEEDEKLPPVGCGTLFRFATPFDFFLIFIGTLTSLANGLMLPLSSLLMGEVLNRMNDDFSAVINEICFLFFAFGVCSLFAGLLQTFCFTLSSERQGKALRDAYLKAALRQEISWHDTQSGAKDIASKVSDYSTTVQNGLGDKLGMVFSSFSSFIFALVLAFTKGWNLSLILLAPLPFLFILIAVLMTRLSKLNSDEQKAYSKANVLAIDTFDNIASVKVFKMASYLITKYQNHLLESYRFGRKIAFTTGFVFATFLTLMFGMYSLGIYWGGHLLAKGAHTFGPNSPLYNGGLIISIFYVLLSAMQAVGGSMQSLAAIAKARASMAHLVAVIDRQSDIDPFDFSEDYAKQRKQWLAIDKSRPKSPSRDYQRLDDAPSPSINSNHKFDTTISGNKILVTRANFTGGIKFQNVTFTYPSRPTQPVLSNFSFEFHPHQNYGIVGSSGCGKSTLFQLIQRLYDPDSGDLLIQIFSNINPTDPSAQSSRSVSNFPTRWVNLKDIYVGPWRKYCVGLVTQEPPLIPGTVADNIRFGAPHSTDEDIVAAAILADCHQAIMKKKEQYNYYTNAGSFSGGEKQRIGLASCIITKPALLLLDEFTSALDYLSEHRLIKNISTVCEVPPQDGQNGQNDLAPKSHHQDNSDKFVKSTICIAHRLITVRHSLILAMKDGNLAEFGTHEELLKTHPNGVYSQMFHAHPDPTSAGTVVETQGVKMNEAPKSPKQFLLQAQREIAAHNIRIRSSNFIKSSDQHFQDQKTTLKANRATRAFRFTPLIKHIIVSHPFLLFFATLSVFAGGASFPLFSYLFGHALKALYEPSVEELKKGVRRYAGLFLVFAAAAGLNTFFSYSIFGLIAEKVISHFRMHLYSNLVKQEMAFFDQEGNTTGILSTKLAKDTTQIRQFITQFLQQVLSFIAQLIITIAMCYQTSPKGTGMMMISFPITVLASYLHFRFVRGYSGAIKEHLEGAGSIAVFAMKNVRLISSFNVENWTCIQFSNLNDEALWTGMVSGLYGGLGYGFSQFCFYFAQALIYYLGGKLVISGELFFSDFFQLSQSMRFVSQQFSMILGQMTALDTMNAAISDMYDLMDRKTLDDAYLNDNIMTSPEAKDALLKTGKFTPITRGHIEFKGVKFHYPTARHLPLLRGISFDTSKKETNKNKDNFSLAVVGASGQGKTTLKNLILHFYQTIQQGGNSRLIMHKRQEYYNKYVRSKYSSDGTVRYQDGVSLKDELKESLLPKTNNNDTNLNSTDDDVVLFVNDTQNDDNDDDLHNQKVSDMTPEQKQEYSKKKAHDFEHGGELRDPDLSGQILIDGVDITRIPLNDLYDYVSFVPQHPEIFNDTVLQNIRCGDETITEEQVIAAAKKAQIHDIIMRLPDQYETSIDSKKLSGGQKIRVCLARAFVRDPVILCLDEVSASLDPINSKKVYLALKQTTAKLTLIISHRLNEITAADSILVFNNGMIAESGNHQELLEYSKQRVEQGMPKGVYATFLENSNVAQ